MFRDDDVAVVYSRSTEHADAPRRAANFRVEDYWCCLTIRSVWTGFKAHKTLI